MSRAEVVWNAAMLTVLLSAAFLAQRLFITIELGGERAGVVELLPILMACTAVAVTVWTRGRALAPFLTRTFAAGWGPYLALSALLPVLGVAIGGYPLRTMGAAEVPLFAVSALVLGSGLRIVDRRGVAGWGVPLMIATVGMAGYAVLQQLLVGHVLPSGPWTDLLTWDVNTQRAYTSNVILGRSSAFYVNPNILGAAAGTSVLLGIFAARGWVSYVIVFASLEALLTSQSRGATIALLAALSVMLLLAWRRREARISIIAPYLGVTALALICWLALVTAGTPAGTFVDRIGQGISIAYGGNDPNVTGRIHFWKLGLELFSAHPLGTLGPPERLLGTAVDSDWVRALLQGSIVYVLALAIALAAVALLPHGDEPGRRLLLLLSVFVAVAAITQLPLEYPGAYLYWAAVGAVVASPATTDRSVGEKPA